MPRRDVSLSCTLLCTFHSNLRPGVHIPAALLSLHPQHTSVPIFKSPFHHLNYPPVSLRYYVSPSSPSFCSLHIVTLKFQRTASGLIATRYLLTFYSSYRDPICASTRGFHPVNSQYGHHLLTSGTISVHALQLRIYGPLAFSSFTLSFLFHSHSKYTTRRAHSRHEGRTANLQSPTRFRSRRIHLRFSYAHPSGEYCPCADDFPPSLVKV